MWSAITRRDLLLRSRFGGLPVQRQLGRHRRQGLDGLAVEDKCGYPQEHFIADFSGRDKLGNKVPSQLLNLKCCSCAGS